MKGFNIKNEKYKEIYNIIKLQIYTDNNLQIFIKINKSQQKVELKLVYQVIIQGICLRIVDQTQFKIQEIKIKIKIQIYSITVKLIKLMIFNLKKVKKEVNLQKDIYQIV